jgi:AcrR family transcriptional regulator
MPRMTREQTRAQTVEKLIKAAGRVVARNGFGAASVDQITAEAGYSRGAFYWNFASKEVILLELLRHHMDAEIAEIRALVEAAESPANLAGRLELWAEQFHADADWALLSAELQLLAVRNAEFAGRYEELQAKHRTALADLLTQMFAKAGRELPMQADDLAIIFKALAQGLALRNAANRDGTASDDSARLLRILLDALIASEKNLTPKAAPPSM